MSLFQKLNENRYGDLEKTRILWDCENNAGFQSYDLLVKQQRQKDV